MRADAPRRFRDPSPAEVAIAEAISAVEVAGRDKLLIDAICLLVQARAKVADFVDKGEGKNAPQASAGETP